MISQNKGDALSPFTRIALCDGPAVLFIYAVVDETTLGAVPISYPPFKQSILRLLNKAQ